MRKKAIQGKKPIQNRHRAVQGQSRGSKKEKSQRDKMADDTKDTLEAKEFRQAIADKGSMPCPGCSKPLTFKDDDYVCDNEVCPMAQIIEDDIAKNKEKKARTNKKWGAVLE